MIVQIREDLYINLNSVDYILMTGFDEDMYATIKVSGDYFTLNQEEYETLLDQLSILGKRGEF